MLTLLISLQRLAGDLFVEYILAKTGPANKSHNPMTDRQRAIAICRAFWNMFKQETAAAIFKAAREYIDEQRAMSFEEQRDMVSVGTREEALQILMKHPDPLSHGAHRYLIRIFTKNAKDVRHGLPVDPTSDTRTISRTRLIRELYDRTVTAKKTTPSAPFFKNSFAYSLFPKLCERIPFIGGRDKDPIQSATFCTEVFSEALEASSITFIPWFISKQGRRTRASRPASVTAWIRVNDPNYRPQVIDVDAILTAPQDLVIAHSSQAATNAHTEDAQEPWSVAGLTLSQLTQFVNKSVPPIEFSWERAKFGCSITEVAPPDDPRHKEVQWYYRWVHMHFSMRNPVHRLALWTAFIVSRMVPQIFFSVNARDAPLHLPKGTTNEPDDIRHALQSMPLYPRDGKGIKDPVPYITITTTLIVALWDPASLLRQRMETHRQGQYGTGNAWAIKHSMCNCCAAEISLNRANLIYLLLQTGGKGLLSPLLARLNIIDPTSRIFQHPPHYRTNYTLRTPEDVRALAEEFFNLLRSDDEYATFRAVSRIAGSQTAINLANKGEFVYPRNYEGEM